MSFTAAHTLTHPRPPARGEPERAVAIEPFEVVWQVDGSSSEPPLRKVIEEATARGVVPVDATGAACCQAAVRVRFDGSELVAAVVVRPIEAREGQEWREAMVLDRAQLAAHHVITDVEGSLVHVDVAGMIHLTMTMTEPAAGCSEKGGARHQLLHARTRLLEVLGVRGGRAERPEFRCAVVD